MSEDIIAQSEEACKELAIDTKTQPTCRCCRLLPQLLAEAKRFSAVNKALANGIGVYVKTAKDNRLDRDAWKAKAIRQYAIRLYESSGGGEIWEAVIDKYEGLAARELETEMRQNEMGKGI